MPWGKAELGGKGRGEIKEPMNHSLARQSTFLSENG